MPFELANAYDFVQKFRAKGADRLELHRTILLNVQLKT